MASNSKRARLYGSAGRACRAEGCRRREPTSYLGGIDGEPEAVAKIKRGGLYKASISLNSPVSLRPRPACGRLAGGPQHLSSHGHPAELALRPTWRNTKPTLPTPRRSAYLRMFGNICHDTRDQCLNFPWSSERRPTEPVGRRLVLGLFGGRTDVQTLNAQGQTSTFDDAQNGLNAIIASKSGFTKKIVGLRPHYLFKGKNPSGIETTSSPLKQLWLI
jgi:hypothetical protein